MPNLVDLHTHSTASDGVYSAGELLQYAHTAGLRVLALTDHDTTNGIEEAAQAAKTLAIELIPGIEINTEDSSATPSRGEGRSSPLAGMGPLLPEIHMLGYFPEYERPAFQSMLQVLRDARVHRGERMVEHLNQQGVHITWERVRTIAHGSVGRPHIAQALLEAGYVQSIPEAFDKYLCTRCPAYVPRYKLSAEDAIHLIASANGLPVMAHPAELLASGKLRDWLPRLCALGMVGLETYYGPYTPEIVEELHVLADQYHLIPTGGSDFHGPGIHPTPLGGRYVPYQSVERLKAVASERRGKTPPPFKLPPPVQEK